MRIAAPPFRLLAIALCAVACCPASGAAKPDFAGDFDEFCRFVGENYAYFDVKRTDWGKVCGAYRPQALAAADRAGFITVLEQSLGQLYDQHAHLGSSTKRSPHLVPSNAQVRAEWDGARALIAEVRPQSGAERAGVRAGMQVLSIDGEAVAAAVGAVEPRFLAAPDAQARAWALQTALAGRQGQQRMLLAVTVEGRAQEIGYDLAPAAPAGPVSSRRIDGAVGYVRFNNSLGDSGTIAAFDAAVDSLADSKALVLDLRDTPSGGNSLVARGIMGRLVRTGQPYQTHELVAEARATGVRRRWTEYVMPRGRYYGAPVLVLVGRWTGSMGEGLAIGLNAARQAVVLGTPMAQLLGALDERQLPASGIVVRIPTEKLFHVDGTAREAFVPCRATPAPGAAAAADAALDSVVALAKAAYALPEAERNAAQLSCRGAE